MNLDFSFFYIKIMGKTGKTFNLAFLVYKEIQVYFYTTFQQQGNSNMLYIRYKKDMTNYKSNMRIQKMRHLERS